MGEGETEGGEVVMVEAARRIGHDIEPPPPTLLQYMGQEQGHQVLTTPQQRPLNHMKQNRQAN